jgi:transcriptional repressor NrdR
MRCPACGHLRDRVVDSRQTEDGRSIRRRRECETCGGRFTTFERIETAMVQVRKRNGDVEPFDASKVAAGVSAACKSRPVDPGQIAVLVADVEDALRSLGKEVTSDEVGLEVLLRLRSCRPGTSSCGRCSPRTVRCSAAGPVGAPDRQAGSTLGVWSSRISRSKSEMVSKPL